MKKPALAAAIIMAALASTALASTSTVTPGSTSLAGVVTPSQVQVFYTGTDSATITYSPGVTLARICRNNFPVTGSSQNCSSSSYSFSGTTPTSTAPLAFTTLLRSAVACKFSLIIRTVGVGTVTVNGITSAVGE